METSQLILIEPNEELQQKVDYFQPTTIGLIVHGEPAIDDWWDIINELSFYDRALHWLLGDILNYGERRWGEIYKEAIDKTDFEYKTLANDKNICNSIDFSRRRENLSFAHHSEIASLKPDKQDHWLDLAEQNTH